MRYTRAEFGQSEREAARVLVDLALAEDLPGGVDLTSDALIPADARSSARYVARQGGVLAGMPVLAMLFERVDPSLRFATELDDGNAFGPQQVLAELNGPTRSILKAERTSLNVLQRLSGIATLTVAFVRSVAGTTARILDTRKTAPGWRVLDKYAVRCGGGQNHRMGLHDAVLVKDNHLAALPDGPERFHDAVRRVRAFAPSRTLIQVEIDTIEQLRDALRAGPDMILLDNMDDDRLSEAVRIRDRSDPEVQLEASGSVTLGRAPHIAGTGVDRISVGALTHSAPAVDIALEIEP